MALSSCQIVHQFNNADGTAASGSVSFLLTKRLTNSGTSIIPASVTVNLNGTGGLSASLYSNVDAGTTPGDSEYMVTFRLLGGQQEEFAIVVPVGPGPVDLGSLLPTNTTGG